MNFKIVGLFLALLVFTACEEKKEAIEFENGPKLRYHWKCNWR